MTPSETTVRRSFIEDVYLGVLEDIRRDIGDGPIWVSIDETTDADSR